MNEWLGEVQAMFDEFAGSTTFWVVAVIAVVVAIAALIPGGRRGR